MKIKYIIAFVLFSFVVSGVRAEGVVTWPTKTTIDTGWVDQDPSASCPETHYPIFVEIKPLKGDAVRYKAIFIPKPKGSFDYKSVVGIKTNEYETLNKDLSAKGFVQISHQVVTLMQGKVHQAVWVRSVKSEAAPSNVDKPSN